MRSLPKAIAKEHRNQAKKIFNNQRLINCELIIVHPLT